MRYISSIMPVICILCHYQTDIRKKNVTISLHFVFIFYYVFFSQTIFPGRIGVWLPGPNPEGPTAKQPADHLPQSVHKSL
jgi:hypothetical protein